MHVNSFVTATGKEKCKEQCKRRERERRGEGHIDNMKTIDYEIKQANER